MRAPTWAGPTSDAAAIAAVEGAPAAWSNPGKCAAIAPCTNHVAEKKKPRISIAVRDGGDGAAVGAPLRAAGKATGVLCRGMVSQFTGAPTRRLSAAQRRYRGDHRNHDSALM